MTIYTKQNASISDHIASGIAGESIRKTGKSTTRLFVVSPAPPSKPEGIFNLALNQGALVQDPVWTAVVL